MSVWTEPTVCELCGNARGGEVKFGIIRRPDNPPGMQYEHVPRCLDKNACRARVEAKERVKP